MCRGRNCVTGKHGDRIGESHLPCGMHVGWFVIDGVMLSVPRTRRLLSKLMCVEEVRPLLSTMSR